MNMPLFLILSQIVLASGRIVNANASNHADLHKALKGGGNNFGIVTQFDLKTFKKGKLWGGGILYPYTSASATKHLQLLQDFNTASGAEVDSFATVINTYSFNNGSRPSYIFNQYMYSKAQAYPDILKNFIDVQPQLSNTMRITNLTDITIEAGTGKSKPSLDHTPIPVNL